VGIPAGSYHWLCYRLEAQLAAKRVVSGQITWWYGSFYNGTLDQFVVTSAWKPSAVFNLELSGERNVGRLSQGNFTKDRLGTRARINLSPDLQFSSFVQYDNESRNLGTNSRVRWTFHPLGELFVVYNHNLDRLARDWELASNELLVKLQYAFRF